MPHNVMLLVLQRIVADWGQYAWNCLFENLPPFRKDITLFPEKAHLPMLKRLAGRARMTYTAHIGLCTFLQEQPYTSCCFGTSSKNA